jgi:ATP-binding protein involved in chromosome partitioning
MFNKVKVPLLGVVENMCMHVCRQCGHEEPIFGNGGGERIAKECNINLLGVLPLDSRIRKQADSGRPIFIAEPHSAIADVYREIANKIAEQLSQSKIPCRFPKIVIEKK